MSDNTRIAKNTGFLYIRMFLIMGVTLYSSRVILDKLGASDYGLYNVVGGVVAMLGFLNGTLSTGTSRFLTYALGKNDFKRLTQTFSTTLFNHIGLALMVVLLLETAGMWFVHHQLLIPPERLEAANMVFHISVFTSFVSITQVPFTASIISHERMSVYAYVSIIESVAKLLIIYLLVVSPFDKLISYAVLFALVQVGVASMYALYCRHHFKECTPKVAYDKGLFKEMARFSGWDFLANIVEMLKSQGVIVLINMFFQPALVAAQAIGNQIAGAMFQFIANVRTAINPQIIKSYAAGDYVRSKELTLSSAIYVYDLLLLLGLPLILLLPPILKIWLVDIPPYTLEFARLIVIQRILSNFDSAFYIPMMASGKLKSNSLAAVYVGFLQFAILYVLLRLGFDVMWVQYMGILMMVVYSFYVKPYILYKEQGYTLGELWSCYWACAKVSVLALVLSVPVSGLFDIHSFAGFAAVLVITVTSVLTASLVFMKTSHRQMILNFIRQKISSRR